MAKRTVKALLFLLFGFSFFFLSLFGIWGLFESEYASAYLGGAEESERCLLAGAETDADETSLCTALPLKEKGALLPQELIVGGELFGMRLSSDGIVVTGFGNVASEEGSIAPAAISGIKKGDVILAVGEEKITDSETFARIVENSEGKPLKLTLSRGGEKISAEVTPVKTEEGYRIGIWLKDSAAGIGTITYFHADAKSFAGLGHGVCENTTGTLFPLREGKVNEAKTEGIERSSSGSPGEIKGSLSEKNTGKLYANTRTGVYGVMNEKKTDEKTVPVGMKGEVKCGKAVILSTLGTEEKTEYEIEIEEILSLSSETKNFVVHVTDRRLLDKAGGIVQGMSGSPILQDGKIIGAVTHVLVGDPTRGYGIFIENMLKNEP